MTNIENKEYRFGAFVIDSKICTKCGIEKNIDDFYRKRSKYESQCKECRLKRMGEISDLRKSGNYIKKEYKICPKCNCNKDVRYFHKGSTKADGLQTYCKDCSKIIDMLRNSTEERRLFRAEFSKKRRQFHKLSWLKYFIEKYGQNPECGICSKKLIWFSDNPDNNIAFDHRHGIGILIQTNPSKWIYSNEFSNENKIIWEQEDFGILCPPCNLKLPTLNRKTWLVNALKYGDQLQ